MNSFSSSILNRLFPGRKLNEQKAKGKSRKKSALVIDTNLGFDHAYALSKKMKVFFCIPPGGTGFPWLCDYITGDGFDITKVDETAQVIGGKPVIDQVDFVVVTDCFFGAMADDLRARGIAVFGPSRALTKIENERVYGWQKLKELGIGVPDGEVVNGMEEFVAYVDKNGDGERVFFPHLNKYRGNVETFSVKNKTEALTMISQIGYGPYLQDVEILIEDQCPGKELGLDIFFNGKDYLRPFLYTIEIKGAGTIGVWIDTNGTEVLLLDKIKSFLQESDYRGSISFEFFWDGIQIRVHDPTCRMAFPCSTLWAKYILNYPEVLNAVAAGQDIKIKVGKKYVAQIGRYTEDDKTWRAIHFPDEIRDRIGFRRVVIYNDDYYFVPGDQIVATAVGSGDTPEDALKECVDVVGQIECPNSSFPGDLVEKMLAIIKEVNGMKSEIDMKF